MILKITTGNQTEFIEADKIRLTPKKECMEYTCIRNEKAVESGGFPFDSIYKVMTNAGKEI